MHSCLGLFFGTLFFFGNIHVGQLSLLYFQTHLRVGVYQDKMTTISGTALNVWDVVVIVLYFIGVLFVGLWVSRVYLEKKSNV